MAEWKLGLWFRSIYRHHRSLNKNFPGIFAKFSAILSSSFLVLRRAGGGEAPETVTLFITSQREAHMNQKMSSICSNLS